KEKANRAFEEQQSLVAISRELSSSLELEKLLSVILSSIRSIARYDRAILTRDITFYTAEDLREMDDPLAKTMYETGIRSVCSVPLIAGNRVWGTLNP